MCSSDLNSEVDVDGQDIELRVRSRISNQFQAHDAYSPFPQFDWGTPSSGTAVMDPLEQTVVLRVVSGSSVAVSGLELVFDAGLPSSFTVRPGAEGFSVTPPVNAVSVKAAYSVPGERWLSPGTHTVTARAINLLGLEDSSTL